MSQRYEPEFKKQIVRLHMEQGRTLISLQKEYNVSIDAISKWVRQFREECQNNQESKQDYDKMQEILRLRKELEESRKENLFLKKAAAFFAKEIDWKSISLSSNIILYLVSDGSWNALVFFLTHIIIFWKTENQYIVQKNSVFMYLLTIFIMNGTELLDTAWFMHILHVQAFI